MGTKVDVPTKVAGGGWFTLGADGSAMWSATYPTPAELAAVRARPSRQTHAAPRPLPQAPTRQALPGPIPRVTSHPPLTISDETRQVIRRHADPPKNEVTRIFKHVAADTVPAPSRAIAEHAIMRAMNLYGYQRSMVQLRWCIQLAPGATVMYAGEFRGPQNMAGKTLSDGHDGRQVTITLRKDLPLETIAEVGLHEGYHACQYLKAPWTMRDEAMNTQAEQMAQEFARAQMLHLRWLINSLAPRGARGHA